MTNPNVLARWKSIKWPATVTELHSHLGGSVPLFRLWEIAVDRGIRGLGSGYEEFIGRIKIKPEEVTDLDSYLRVYDTIELIQSGPVAVRESVIIAAHRAYLTGGMLDLGPGGETPEGNPLFRIGKLELRFNPLKRTGAVFLKGQQAGLYDVDRVIKAACSAVEDIEIASKGKIQIGLIFCFGRDMTREANMILAEKTVAWRARSNKIVGVDLAGHESINPLSSPDKLADMKAVFDACGGNLGKTIHVGETPHVDLETFIKTIEAVNPTRVAHPIVAFRALWERKDDRGIKLLKERNLVCELCVKSNLLTRAVRDVSEYGKIIQTLDQHGIRYTFSTDAPSLQGTSLAQELFLLFESGAINEEQMLRALTVADQASFIRN